MGGRRFKSRAERRWEFCPSMRKDEEELVWKRLCDVPLLPLHISGALPSIISEDFNTLTASHNSSLYAKDPYRLVQDLVHQKLS